MSRLAIVRGNMDSGLEATVTGGAASQRIGDVAWDMTPLGAPENWPQSLRTAVDLILGSVLPSALFIGPELRQVHNQAYADLYADESAPMDALGRPAVEGDPIGRLALAATEVFAGRSVVLQTQDLPLAGRSSDFGFNLCYSPFRNEEGRIDGVLLLAVPLDPTSLRESLEKSEPDDRRALLGELQHRVRNILAVVRSLIARSADTSDTVEDLAAHLDGRIAAFARIQAVVVRNPEAGVDLENLIRDELLAQNAEEDRIVIDGPEIVLSPKAAEVVTMAAHELATNATKYGALSQPGGQLQITWLVRQMGARKESWLALNWMESGVGVATSAPRREGFGTILLKRRLPYELGGKATIEFRPGGVFCQIAFPLDAVAGRAARAEDRERRR